MTNKEKQLLMLSITFIYHYAADKDIKHKEIQKLLTTLYKLRVKHIDVKEFQDLIDWAFKYFAKITDGKDIVVNTLVLGVNLAMVFAEVAKIDSKLENNILKKANKIQKLLDAEYKEDEGFKNAMDLVKEFTKGLL